MIFLISAVTIFFLIRIMAGAQRASFEEGEFLFKEGKFEEAAKFFEKAAEEEPENIDSFLRLAEISLFSNRLDEAEKWLNKVFKLRPDEKKAKSLLAEVYYRQDDFKKASLLFRDLGRNAAAEKYASFRGQKPYRIKSKTRITALDFVITDPLPVVGVRVNGSEEVNFIIDTGASELVIDSDFAEEIGAQKFGSETGTFAGGKKAPYEQGRVDSLVLGDFLIQNVPVHMMNVRQFSKPIFRDLRIDGIIGTVLFYHFLSTLDYEQGKLILARKNKKNLKRLLDFASAA